MHLDCSRPMRRIATSTRIGQEWAWSHLFAESIETTGLADAISNQTGADDRKGSQIQDLALDYLTVKGFRSIKAIDKLRLQPLNVLIGANGSGNQISWQSFVY